VLFANKYIVGPYAGMNNICSKCDMTNRNALLSDSAVAGKPVYLWNIIMKTYFILRHQLPSDVILHMFSRMKFVISFQNLMLQWAEHFGLYVQKNSMLITRGDGRQISASGLFMQWLTYNIRLFETHICNSKGGILLHLILYVGKLSEHNKPDDSRKVPRRFVQELYGLNGINTVQNSTVHITIFACP
jgi:hypothetical protein